MSFPQHCSSHNCNQIRKGISSVLSHISRYLHPKHDKISLLPLLLAGAMAPSNLTVNILTTSTHPEMSSWLLCEVSGFFPENIHLMWLSVHSKMKSTNFVTANPTAQPGGTFQTWSVLRLPVALSSSLDTYTCVVEHEASKTKLNASKSLAISGKSQLGKSVNQGQHLVPMIDKYSCLGRGGLHCLDKRNTVLICFSLKDRTT